MIKNIIAESKLSESNSELLYLKNVIIPQLEHQIAFIQSKEYLYQLLENFKHDNLNPNESGTDIIISCCPLFIETVGK